MHTTHHGNRGLVAYEHKIESYYHMQNTHHGSKIEGSYDKHNTPHSTKKDSFLFYLQTCLLRYMIVSVAPHAI